MIKAITITLSNGESLTMTLATPDTSLGFAIVDCDGITPGSATLNGSEWVTVAGGSYESSHIPKRTINLALRFLPTALSESVADIRRKTYKWFPLTKKIRLTFHHESFFGKKKSYYIEGYVERNEADKHPERSSGHRTLQPGHLSFRIDLCLRTAAHRPCYRVIPRGRNRSPDKAVAHQCESDP